MKIKSVKFWLNKKLTGRYLMVYIVIFLYLRAGSLISGHNYYNILFYLIFGSLSFYAGFKAITEGKIRVYSRIYYDKSVKFVGIVLISLSLLIMVFLR